MKKSVLTLVVTILFLTLETLGASVNLRSGESIKIGQTNVTCEVSSNQCQCKPVPCNSDRCFVYDIVLHGEVIYSYISNSYAFGSPVDAIIDCKYRIKNEGNLKRVCLE